jgi:hypothetical protein
MYTHFKRHVDTLVNVAQAVVRRNQVVTTLGTSCNCRSQTWLVFIFCYRYILSITILIQFFPFFKMCIHFLAPSVVSRDTTLPRNVGIRLPGEVVGTLRCLKSLDPITQWGSGDTTLPGNVGIRLPSEVVGTLLCLETSGSDYPAT